MLAAKSFDVCVVGAGIVGLSTAYTLLQRHPSLRLVLLEKEREIATHQTARNSGVIHAGIYYRPGSDRARLCRKGMELMYEFVEEHQIAHHRCGKLIIATDEGEMPLLHELFRRGNLNNVPDLSMVDAEGIASIEPHASGVMAIHSPHSGITDFRAVANKLKDLLLYSGVEIITSFQVNSVEETDATTYHIGSSCGRKVRAQHIIGCAGLQSDRLAKMSGIYSHARVIPFLGKWNVLKPEYSHLVKGLIYPVPNPLLPFLGVHFTKKISGEVWTGPNSLLSLSREGRSALDLNIMDSISTFSYSGFYRLLAKHWRSGLNELVQELSEKRRLSSMANYLPEITAEHFQDIYYTGIRSQAVELDGTMHDDFLFEEGPRQLHVRNAPSPAATSCFAISQEIIERVLKRGWLH